MNERATKEFITTGGHKLTLNEYIIGSEKRAITEIYLAAGDIKPGVEVPKTRAMFLAEDKSIELVVVEMDGSRDNLLARFLALPVTDYEEIKDAVKEVLDGKKKQ